MAVVDFDRDGGVALITLNRPEARNSLSPEVLVRLRDAWEAVEADDDLRVAIITGAGDKAFCAGADLGQLIPLTTGARKPANEYDEAVVADPTLGRKAMLRDWTPSKPVIAAVNGHAIAGGCEIVQGTDIRVAAESARFGVQEVKWGLYPLGGSSVRLPRQFPEAIAMELLLTGDLLDAATCLRYGFVNHVVPQDQVLGKAQEIAAKIAANGPLAGPRDQGRSAGRHGVDGSRGDGRRAEVGSPGLPHGGCRRGAESLHGEAGAGLPGPLTAGSGRA